MADCATSVEALFTKRFHLNVLASLARSVRSLASLVYDSFVKHIFQQPAYDVAKV
jgi:hypothetical protein